MQTKATQKVAYGEKVPFGPEGPNEVLSGLLGSDAK